MMKLRCSPVGVCAAYTYNHKDTYTITRGWCRYGDLLAHWQYKARLRGQAPPYNADVLAVLMDGVSMMTQKVRLGAPLLPTLVPRACHVVRCASVMLCVLLGVQVR